MKWIKLMQKKISLFKLLFLVFFLFFWKNIALGFSIENQSDSNLYLNKKNSNNFIFLKKKIIKQKVKYNFTKKIKYLNL